MGYCFLARRVVDGNHHVFSASPLIEKSICFFHNQTQPFDLSSNRDVLVGLTLLVGNIKYEVTAETRCMAVTSLIKLHLQLNAPQAEVFTPPLNKSK